MKKAYTSKFHCASKLNNIFQNQPETFIHQFWISYIFLSSNNSIIQRSSKIAKNITMATANTLTRCSFQRIPSYWELLEKSTQLGIKKRLTTESNDK